MVRTQTVASVAAFALIFILWMLEVYEMRMGNGKLQIEVRYREEAKKLRSGDEEGLAGEAKEEEEIVAIEEEEEEEEEEKKKRKKKKKEKKNVDPVDDSGADAGDAALAACKVEQQQILSSVESFEKKWWGYEEMIDKYKKDPPSLKCMPRIPPGKRLTIDSFERNFRNAEAPCHHPLLVAAIFGIRNRGAHSR